MAALTWNETGKRFYETGVDRGVLYPAEGNGVAWNGLISVTENPTGAEASPFYADNIKYLNLMSNEEFGATIEAYMYPDEFAECDGSAALQKGVFIGQQTRKTFGLCYRTILGNDVKLNENGYKLHLIYNCLAAPSDRSYSSVNESIEPNTFSWEVTTTPIPVEGHKPTAVITIDSTKADPTKLAALEKILYGDASNEPRLPLPSEIATLMASDAS